MVGVGEINFGTRDFSVNLIGKVWRADHVGPTLDDVGRDGDFVGVF